MLLFTVVYKLPPLTGANKKTEVSQCLSTLLHIMEIQ